MSFRVETSLFPPEFSLLATRGTPDVLSRTGVARLCKMFLNAGPEEFTGCKKFCAKYFSRTFTLSVCGLTVSETSFNLFM